MRTHPNIGLLITYVERCLQTLATCTFLAACLRYSDKKARSLTTTPRLFPQDIVLRLHTNPRRIFGLPEQPDTYIEVEVGSEWTIPDTMKYSKSRWTPFAGMKVYGSVKRVFLRGQIAMVDGKVYWDIAVVAIE